MIGSFAREEQTDESDVDLLIDLAESTPRIFDLKRALRSELEARFGRTVELASERYREPCFREHVRKEQIHVWQG